MSLPSITLISFSTWIILCFILAMSYTEDQRMLIDLRTESTALGEDDGDLEYDRIIKESYTLTQRVIMSIGALSFASFLAAGSISAFILIKDYVCYPN
jgi:hypothetical protein